MKNTMKKIVGMIIILAIMIGIGAAAYAANKEPMKDYERVLLGYGFIQDESDDTIWYFDGDLDGYQVKAFYDAYYDSGSIYAVDPETGDDQLISFKWQPSELEFDSIAEFEFPAKS